MNQITPKKQKEKSPQENILPKISVVICAYNVSNLINNVLTSLQQQTFSDFEVVIVNDGSTDDTSPAAKISAEKLGLNQPNQNKVGESKQDKVRVLDLPHQGLSATRNTGINAAQAEIVAIIDADCHAEPQWLEEIYREIETKGETVVTGNTKIPRSTFLGDCISGLGYPGGGHLGFDKMWPVDENGYTNHLAGGNCAFLKEAILKLGAFNPKLTITADDVYLSQKILENSLKIKYNPFMIMYHPPRKDLGSFLKWHYQRGRGSYFFKQQVGSFNKFYKLRFWSTKNMIKEYWKSPKILIMIPLLALSFITQKVGYFREKYF